MSENKRKLTAFLMAYAILFSLSPMNVYAVGQTETEQAVTEQTEATLAPLSEAAEQTEDTPTVTALRLATDSVQIDGNLEEYDNFSGGYTLTADAGKPSGSIAARWTAGFLYLGVEFSNATVLKLDVNGKSLYVDFAANGIFGVGMEGGIFSIGADKAELSIPLSELDLLNITEDTSVSLGVIFQNSTDETGVALQLNLSFEEAEEEEEEEREMPVATALWTQSGSVTVDGVASEANWMFDSWIRGATGTPDGKFAKLWNGTDLYIAIKTDGATSLKATLNGKVINLTLGTSPVADIAGVTVKQNGNVLEMKVPFASIGLVLHGYTQEMPLKLELTNGTGTSKFNGKLTFCGEYVSGEDTSQAVITHNTYSFHSAKFGYTEGSGETAKNPATGVSLKDAITLAQSTGQIGATTETVDGVNYYHLWNKYQEGKQNHMVQYSRVQVDLGNLTDIPGPSVLEFDVKIADLPEVKNPRSPAVCSNAYQTTGFGVAMGRTNRTEELAVSIANIADQGLTLYVKTANTAAYAAVPLNRQVSEDTMHMSIRYGKDTSVAIFIDDVQVYYNPQLGETPNGYFGGDCVMFTLWNPAYDKGNSDAVIGSDYVPLNSDYDSDITVSNVKLCTLNEENMLEDLTFDDIKGENSDPSAVSANLSLPTILQDSKGRITTNLVWSSSPAGYISATGEVTSPEELTEVVLTATVAGSNPAITKSFNLTVSMPPVDAWKADSVIVDGNLSEYHDFTRGYTFAEAGTLSGAVAARWTEDALYIGIKHNNVELLALNINNKITIVDIASKAVYDNVGNSIEGSSLSVGTDTVELALPLSFLELDIAKGTEMTLAVILANGTQEIGKNLLLSFYGVTEKANLNWVSNVTVDGKLTEMAWQMHNYFSGRPGSPEGVIGKLWNEDNLFLAIDTAGATALSLTVAGQKVEIGDLANVPASSGVATAIAKDGDIVEMKIPFASFYALDNYGQTIDVSVELTGANGTSGYAADLQFVAQEITQKTGAATQSASNAVTAFWGGSVSAAQASGQIGYTSQADDNGNYTYRMWNKYVAGQTNYAIQRITTALGMGTDMKAMDGVITVDFDLCVEDMPVFTDPTSGYNIWRQYQPAGLGIGLGRYNTNEEELNLSITNMADGLVMFVGYGPFTNTYGSNTVPYYGPFKLNKQVGDQFHVTLHYTEDGKVSAFVDDVKVMDFQDGGYSYAVSVLGIQFALWAPYYNSTDANRPAGIADILNTDSSPKNSGADMDVEISNVKLGSNTYNDLLNGLSFDDIKGENTNVNSVSTNLVLPTKVSDDKLEAEVIWSSNNPQVVSNSGVVTAQLIDTPVTLTATLAGSNPAVTKSFELTVPATAAALELSVQQYAVIEEQGGYAYFSFTPEESGTYEFRAVNENGYLDTYGYLYDSQWNELAHDDDSAGNGSFRISWAMTAGETYYCGARYYSSDMTGSFPVVVEKMPEIISMEFTPVSIIEGTCGYMTSGYDEETGTNKKYYYYNAWELLYKSTYTVTFSDGTVISDSNTGINYNDTWYSFDYSSNQNYSNRWTAGNTYSITVSLLGKTAEVPVTIMESPLESITFTPVSAVENTCGSMSSYWENGVEKKYYHYSESNLLYKSNYVATFSDGTVLTGCDTGFNYNNEWYSFSASTNQGYYDQWTVGNTYTMTVSVLGQAVEVPVTIKESPVVSVSFEPIALAENTCGYENWGNTYYYHYNWQEMLSYMVTFRDGTTKMGTYYDAVIYDGDAYKLSNYTDNQSDNPWWADNTYQAQVDFMGKTYDVYVSITSPVEDNGFEYAVQYGKVIITNCTLKTEILQIPETIEGCSVVGITGLGDSIKYAKELRIPDSVTMMPYLWELRSQTLEKLVLGRGVSLDSEYSWDWFVNLKHIEVSKDNPYLRSVDGVLYDKGLTALIIYPNAKEELHVVPDSVTELNFSQLGGNANVQMGSGVEGYRMIDGIIYTADMTEVISATAAATGSYVMPETVERIRGEAFKNSKLTDVTISPSVTDISYTVFQNCIDLESITVPESVQFFGFDTSYGCDNLKRINISNLEAWCQTNFYWGGNPLEIAHDLYLNGELVTDLVIPDTVKMVYFASFKGSSIKSVTMPDSVQTIQAYAFKDSAVESIKLSESLSSIGYQAFENSALKSVELPGSVTMILESAFRGCKDLEEVTLNEGLQHIGYETFKDSGVRSIILPDSLAEMGGSSFANCEQLETLIIGSGLTDIPGSAFRNTALKTVTLPRQIRNVWHGAFANSQLTEVIFDCDEVYLDMSAFEGCPLGDLKLDDNVKEVSWSAFAGANATQVKIPDSITYITYRAFALNKNLVSVTIPDTVSCIEPMAFHGDDNLSHVLYKGTEEQWTNVENYSEEVQRATIHYNATGDEVTTQQDCTTVRFYCSVCDKWETVRKGISTHAFIDGVCSICGYECYWDYVINEDGTLTITGYTGRDKAIVMPEEIDDMKVTAFTTAVFTYNTRITEITLPEGITEIPDEAFLFCEDLTKVNLPESLTRIGDRAFAKTPLAEVDIPDAVNYIGEEAFTRTNLTEIRIPRGVTEITYYAFANIGPVENIFIPDTVTAIGYNAFQGCGDWDAHITVEVPASVTEIKGWAFDFYSFQSAIVTAVFKGDAPKMNDAFGFAKGTVFYPADATGWENVYFGDMEAYACEVPEITKEPEDVLVANGETALLSAEAYGQRLRYQWYIAAPGSDTFEAIGGDSIELSMVIDETNDGTRAYCEVTDVLGQTARTETVTLGNPYVGPNGIRISRLPYTLEHNLHQPLRTRGLEVMLTYTDGSEEVITDFEISGYDRNVAGTQTVTITYGEFTATYEVFVIDHRLSHHHAETDVDVAAAPDAVPAGAQLHVEQAEPELPEELQGTETVVFDITLEVDGEPVQPEGEVEVSIPVPGHMHSKRCKVYHIDDEGNVTDMQAHYEDGRMVFTTSHFSYYAVVEAEGVTVSGTATDGATVELISAGEVLETVEAIGGVYSIENVVENDYQIRVGKENYAARTYDITVGTEDVTLDVEIHLIGDINGDGRVNVIDVNKANSHVAMATLLEGYALACADVNGDGLVNITDVNKINAHVANKKLLW